MQILRNSVLHIQVGKPTEMSFWSNGEEKFAGVCGCQSELFLLSLCLIIVGRKDVLFRGTENATR
jgi:hypothetical protein